MGFKNIPEVEPGYPDEPTPYFADDEESFRPWQRLYLRRWLGNLEMAASRPATTEEPRVIVRELVYTIRQLRQGWEPVSPPVPTGAGPSRRRRSRLPRLR